MVKSGVLLQILTTLQRSALVTFVGALALNLSAAPRSEHVFIVSIDGGKPAVIAQSEMPVLKRLVHEGASTWTATTIFPSSTLPSHTSMLTGVVPKKHKMSWNSWKLRRGIVGVPTVFSEAKAAGLSTAMFVGKEKFRHLVQPGSVDWFDYNIAECSPTVGVGQKSRKSDTVMARAVAHDAALYIAEKKPNLCFIHFADTDSAGHEYGWGSPQQINAFAEIDAALSVILKAIKDAGICEQSVLIITADHGGHRKTHGGKKPDDMRIPWIVWGKDVKPDVIITAPVTTCDTAATALWLLGVPIPNSFDGTPVRCAFR